jgi:hypothetical protein
MTPNKHFDDLAVKLVRVNSRRSTTHLNSLSPKTNQTIRGNSVWSQSRLAQTAALRGAASREE